MALDERTATIAPTEWNAALHVFGVEDLQREAELLVFGFEILQLHTGWNAALHVFEFGDLQREAELHVFGFEILQRRTEWDAALHVADCDAES